MRASLRPWLPATGLLVAVSGGLALGGVVTLRQHAAPPAAAVVDVHSKAAVIAAVENYYRVEARARESGDASLIDAVTTGPDSLVATNFHTFIAEERARQRRSVVLQNHFEGWVVEIDGERATATFTFWLKGHDVDLADGRQVEADQLTAKTAYRAELLLSGGRWLMDKRTRVSG